MWGQNKIKVCFMACLFFYFTFSLKGQHKPLSNTLAPYYEKALHYKVTKWPLLSLDTLRDEDQPAAIYINSLSATLHTLLTHRDPAVDYREAWAKWLERCTSDDPFCAFVSSELQFHQSLIYFLHGEHFKSFLQFRKVYRMSTQEQGYPWSLKTSGTLNIMLSAVPDQYQWLLSILGYHGDHQVGMHQLDSLQVMGTFLNLETHLIQLLFKQYLFDQNTFADWLMLRTAHPKSPLVQFLFNTVALKNHQSQHVIDLQVDSPIDQVYGQLGEAYLNKLQYDSALMYFRTYENNLGEEMTSEMMHKIWLCHKLLSNAPAAERYRQRLIAKNASITEADENALHHLHMDTPAAQHLMKIRLATDGGYYLKAGQLLEQMQEADFTEKKNQVEYVYRKARWLQLSGQPEAAIPYYQKVLQESPNSGWYFAPNSAYLLGRLFEDRNEDSTALAYYEMVSGYRQYPYRNSLENKSDLRMRLIKSRLE